MLVFDAEQLSFKKMDKEAIVWRTINGNHVPIPKYGTREEKAQAIKEWFANKNKSLPIGKGRVSFYSARVEHEAPKRSARGSGEHAQVHGDGQYTLKGAENNLMNYFNKFQNKTSVALLNMNDEEMESIKWIRGLGAGWKGIEGMRKTAEQGIKTYADARAKQLELAAEAKKLRELPDEELDKWLADTDAVQALAGRASFENKDYARSWLSNFEQGQMSMAEENEKRVAKFEKEVSAFNDLVKSGKIKESHGIYMVGDKVYRKSDSAKVTQKDVQFGWVEKLYFIEPEKRKEYVDESIAKLEDEIKDYQKAISELKVGDWQYHWYRREYLDTIARLERDIAWWKKVDYEHITPAKAQMSKVRLPASKTYLREATSLNNQSPYIKNAIKSAMVNEYGVQELRDMGLPDVADEYESIIDDALSPNGSSAENIEQRLANIQKNFIGEFPMEHSYAKYRPDDRGKKLKQAEELIKHASLLLSVSLLAKDDNDKLVMNNGRGFYSKFGSHLIDDDWWRKMKTKDRKASDLLGKYGISGIAYRGHGVSHVSGWVDGDGNVTFDPKKMKVLERTTEREVIQRWIDRQNKIRGK